MRSPYDSNQIEDHKQLTTFAYGNSGTTNGRLLSVTSKACVGARTFEERYDYTLGGLVTQKKLPPQRNLWVNLGSGSRPRL